MKKDSGSRITTSVHKLLYWEVNLRLYAFCVVSQRDAAVVAARRWRLLMSFGPVTAASRHRPQVLHPPRRRGRR